MKESDITQEVIRLSKEIAEYWRMEIYDGCWVLIGNNRGLVIDIDENHYYIGNHFYLSTHGIPIPSISDCLEKLRELGWLIRSMNYDLVNIVHPGREQNYRVFQIGSTLHEALLSALLEVIKNASK